jgi:hypothetical protein
MESLQVAPRPGEFTSEEDFFRRVPFPQGSKYVRSTVQEFNQLPAVQ